MFTRSRIILVLVAGLAGLMAAAPWGMSQGLAGSGLKVGFVNSVEVLQGTDEGRQKMGEFQQWAEARQQELQQDKTELDRLREQFAAQERTLNPDTRTEMMRTIEDRDRRLRRKQEDSQLESEARNRQLLEQIGTKIQTIINEYAQQNGYSVIFLRNESQSYVDPSLDITKELVSIYNQRHPGPSSASSAPAQP
ncbi:MAG: OmpH family outer membrane protein [Acidobacteriota bacterium]|nr:OmpH family outer membrane protein [Acidobacteriota bacterium]